VASQDGKGKWERKALLKGEKKDHAKCEGA